MSLYSFNGLEEFLNRQGFPKAGVGTFQLLKRNLVQGMQQGDIILRTDGIYCKIDDQEYKGYIFNQKPDISRYGVPRFHAAECEIVAKRHNLNGDYIFTTSENVQLYDRGQNGIPFPSKDKFSILQLCSKCSQLLGARNKGIIDTEDFHAMLIEQYGSAAEPENSAVDIFGYTPDFSVISKKIRESKLYRCDQCRVDLSISTDRRYLHVHHLNGRKTDNRPQNLQCLCIRCHAAVDAKHKGNFETSINKRELEAFNKKFPTTNR